MAIRGHRVNTGRVGTLVGRHRELQVLVAACKAASGTVVLRGDAGVGKTRLLDSALEEAELLGHRVLRAGFDELDRDVPYAGLRRALGPAVAAETRPELAEEARAVAAALDLTAGDGSRDAMAVAFESARRLLVAWSAERPVVLALDDLHAADPDSRRVIGLLAAHLAEEPVAILATMRMREPDAGVDVRALVERLVAEGLTSVVDVGELDRADTRALVHARLGTRPDDAVVDVVWEASRGNPFYAVEAVRSLEEGDRLSLGADRVGLADESGSVALSMRATLLHRIFRLGPEARRVGRVLTAFQRIPLRRLPLVADLCGLPVAAVERAFDALAAAGVLRESEGREWEFSHPIVKNTLYDDLGPAERRRIHAEIAVALSEERAEGRPVALAELAVHTAAAAEPGDAAAIEILTAAGHAAASSAPLTAAHWFAQARRLAGDDDPTLLAAEARARYLAADIEAAAALGARALAALPVGPNRTRTAGIVVQCLTTLGRFEEALATADDLLASGDGPAPPRLRAVRATPLVYLDRFDEAEAELQGALDDTGDDVSRAAVLGGLAACAYARGELDRCHRLLDEQAELEARLGPGSRLASLAVRASYLGLAGAVADAERALAQAQSLSEQLGGSAFRPVLDVAAAILAWLAGRWDEAVDRSRLVGVEPERAGVYGVLARCAELVIAVDRGQFARAEELADEVRGSRLGASFASWSIARRDLALGELDAARSSLEAVLAADRAHGRRSSEHVLLGSLVDVALAAGDDAAARRWTEELEAFADHPARPWASMLAGRARARVDGDPAAAVDSAEGADAQGVVVEAARSRLVAGSLGHEPERELTAAHEVFRAVGAEPELRATGAAMRDHGLTPPRPVRTAEGPLTDTERELARLVHEGLTNRQIARVIHLSPKTIEVYLSRVFTKTGCANRLELALAVSDGLLD